MKPFFWKPWIKDPAKPEPDIIWAKVDQYEFDAKF